MPSKLPHLILLSLFGLIVFFHLGILVKWIPYTIAWGGRLSNDSEMYGFETISIVLNAVIILVLLMHARYITFSFHEKTLRLLLWLFFILFLINTIGNAFAKTTFEKIFTFVTLLIAVLIWRILRAPRPVE